MSNNKHELCSTGAHVQDKTGPDPYRGSLGSDDVVECADFKESLYNKADIPDMVGRLNAMAVEKDLEQLSPYPSDVLKESHKRDAITLRKAAAILSVLL